MSIEIIAAVVFVSFFVLLFLGFPCAFGLFAVSMIGLLLYFGPRGMYIVVPQLFNTVTTDIYVALPLFIFMAAVFQFSGVGESLYVAMHKWAGGMNGGLAIGTIAICTLIAAITGLAATATLLMGMIAYPEMTKRGYDKRLAIGAITAGGTLGPIIPPSMPMIVVGGLTGASIGKLFMGGLIPGLMCAGFFILYIWIKARLNPNSAPALPKEERADLKEKLRSTRGLILPIALILLVLGGIYGGIFTPSEAGGIGAIGALIATAINRKLNKLTLLNSVTSTLKMTGMLMWLLMGGVLFATLLNTTQVTAYLSQAIVGLPIPPEGILFMMLAIVFVEGMFMETSPITFTNLPIMWPVALQLGFDPIWFLVLFVVCEVIGFITPPFGMCLFYAKGLGYKGLTMGDIYKGAWPFVGAMVAVLVICAIIPETITWMPNMMIK